MKKQVGVFLLSTAMIATCAAALAACNGDDKAKGFEETTVFHVDLTMSTAIGPLGTLCNPGTLTFKPDGTAKMNITFTDSAIVMMDNLLGFRIGDFVDEDTYELNDDATVITYHSTRKSMSNPEELAFGDLEIPIEYLSDNSMKFTFDIGKAIPDTVLYFYSNENMMPKPADPDPTPVEKYGVTYEVSGKDLKPVGENSKLPEAETFEDETVITLPELDYTNGNAIFRGWALDGIVAHGLYAPGDKFTVKSEVTFAAVWDETATVTFTDGKGLSQTYETPVGTYIVLPECSFASSVATKGFAYWTYEGNTSKKYPGDTLKIEDDLVVTANYTNYVTVTFTAGTDGEGNDFFIRIPAESKLVFPVCPFTYQGEGEKGFSLWQAGSYTKYYVGDVYKSLKADTTFVAQWDTYVTVSFELAGGTGTLPAKMKVVKNSKIIIPECTIKAPENAKASGSWCVKGNTSAIAFDSLQQIKGDTIYTPLWNWKRTISFNTQVEGSPAIASVECYETESIVLPEVGCTNGNKRFAGWATSKTATYGTKAGATHSVSRGKDYPLYAIWDDLATVAFSGGEGATGTTASIEAYERDKIKLPECGFQKEGYTFDGWKIGTEKTIRQPGYEYTVPQTEKIPEIVAVWKKNVTMEFVGGEGATGTMDSIVYGETMKIKLPDNEGLNKEGFIFGGWTDGTNEYQPGAEYTVPAWEEGKKVVFTAVWLQGTPYADYTVKFRAGLGSATVYINESKNERVSLYDFFPEGSLTELVLRPNLTADFGYKSSLAQMWFNTHNKAGNLGFASYQEFLDAYSFEMRNVPYTYDKETNKVLLKGNDGKTLEIQLKYVEKNDTIGYDNVQFEVKLPRKLGAVETLLYVAPAEKPVLLSENKTFTGKTPADAGQYANKNVVLTLNADGTGKLDIADGLAEKDFTHYFSADFKSIIWLGTGDRIEGKMGTTEDGKMTITLSILGFTVVITEK